LDSARQAAARSARRPADIPSRPPRRTHGRPRAAAGDGRGRAWLIDELLPEIVGAVQAEAASELAHEVRTLNLEIGELKLAISEAKLMLAHAGAAGLDLHWPKPATPAN
jgi:hypothetical protein